MIRKTLAILLVLILESALTYAHEPELQTHTKKVKNAGSGGFMIGIEHLNLTNLNNVLKARGFENLGNSQISFGGGGYGIVNGKILLGGEGSSFSTNASSTSEKITFTGSYGFFDIGYVVLSRKRFKLFPLLGIGGGGFNLRITEKAVSPTFDEILDDPRREANISAMSFMLNFAIGMDYSLGLVENKERESSLLLGIRAGYIFDPIKADWKMCDTEVLGGPDLRMTGPYIKLIIGGSGTRK